MGGFGEGVHAEAAQRRAQGRAAGLDHSDASLGGGGSYRLEDSPGLMGPTHGVHYLSASLWGWVFFFPIYYLTGHSTSNQAEIDASSAPRRNLDLHAQLLVLETSLTSTLATSPVSLLYAPFSL